MEQGIKSLKGKLIIRGSLEVKTGLHIGGSGDYAPIGAVDSPFIRDPYTKLPIIPGSSLKGKLRTLLARALADDYIVKKIEYDKEEVKRLFGCSTSGHASRLQFSDSFMSEKSIEDMEKRELDTYFGEVKHENTINRVTSIANPRQIERVPAGTIFDLNIVYNIEREEDIKDDIDLLATGLRLLQLDYLGGHGSRGYGRVAVKNLKAELFTPFGNTDTKLEVEVTTLLEGSCL